MHPTLRRHYSTIGIGDVFVQEPEDGPWRLPSSYLRTEHTTDAPTLFDSDQGPSSLLLDEMIGTIKNTPEDFIVREMAQLQGTVRVADILLANELQDSGATRTLDDDNKVRPMALPTKSPESHHHQQQQQRQTTSLQSSPTECSDTDREQVTKKAKINPVHLNAAIVAPSKDNPSEPRTDRAHLWEKFDTSLILDEKVLKDNHSPAQHAFELLEQLEMEARHAAQRNADTTASTSFPKGINVQTTSPQPLPTVLTFWLKSSPSDLLLRKRQRGRIHEALRNAFPVLVAESPNDGKGGSPTASSSTEATNHDEGKFRIDIRVDDCFFPLATYLYAPHMDLPPLYAFAKRGYEYAKETERKTAGTKDASKRNSSKRRPMKFGPILRLKPDLPRCDRRPIHQLIDSESKGFLGTETINDFPLAGSDTSETFNSTVETTTAIAVHWTSVAARKFTKRKLKAANAVDGAVPLSSFLLCVIQKRQKEHLALINTLSTAFRCRSSDIGLAGIKDYQAVASQFCTLERFDACRVFSSADYLLERGINVVPLFKVDKALSKGDLLGNRFEIVIRNLRRVRVSNVNNLLVESFPVADRSHLRKMVERIQNGGFINFYGEQRVGEPGLASNAGVRASDIGRAMLQQDFASAIDLLISGRRIANGVELADHDVDKFRQTWKETGGDPVATLKCLPPGGTSVPRERAVLKGLVRYGKDNPLAALRCLQRNERLFFISGVRKNLFVSLQNDQQAF